MFLFMREKLDRGGAEGKLNGGGSGGEGNW